MAIKGVEKIQQSQQFKKVSSELKNRVQNSETLNNVKETVVKKVGTVVAATESKKCPNCRAKVSSNAKFCSHCGTKL